MKTAREYAASRKRQAKSLPSAFGTDKESAHMKNLLKSSTLCVLALVSLSTVTARAQTRDKQLVLFDRQTSDSARPVDGQTRDARLISARAGGINLASGDVKARRAGSPDWQSISVKDDLKTGDAARTGADSRVEVLLNPGSYLRAGALTEFELTDASLDHLRINVLRGNVLVEATGYDELGLNIQITTPRTHVELARSGVYRIDVAESGETVVSVQKGRARVGDGDASIVLKGGKVARVGAGGVEVAKVEKKQRDGLDQWSRERGRELARVNTTLASRQTNSLLDSNGFWDLFRAEYPSSYLGLWMWSFQTGCYTFLPYSLGWRSPYGFNYGGVLVVPDSYNRCWGCDPHFYRPFITQSPHDMPVNNGVSFGGLPPPSSGSGGSSSSGSTTFGGGNSNRGGGTVSSPPPSPPVERPMRERTYEPGSRPLDH